MYFFDNPVMQRELLVNLRTKRAFALLFFFQMLLAGVVFIAWPQESRLQANAVAARRLVDMFFLGQYVLASLMAPSFAAAAISGEKERKTYEMLLASPMKPAAILLGKLLAALTPLAILIFSTLPIVMLCLPLGGVSVYEVLAAYFGLMVSVVTFGMISVACSSYFHRTASALVVSYLLILPLVLFAVFVWQQLGSEGTVRLLLVSTVLPAGAGAITVALFASTAARLLHPPDVGSEAKEVIDLDTEAREAVGLVIQPDQFPDKLFAPAKREGLMEDGANPIYDKETRSEIFSQGTRMLRVVIQMSMVLAIPIMAFCLFMVPYQAPWFIAYVLVFNVLVGPVFSAGSVTSERERQTLELLLTTTITPMQILWGKLIAGLRVSSVLTFFLVWPMLLAGLMVSYYWRNLPALGAYLLIVLLTCLTTAMLALFCSVLFQKTSMALMTAYLALVVMFCAPPAVNFFANTFYTPVEAKQVQEYTFMSPFTAAFAVPLSYSYESRGQFSAPDAEKSMSREGSWKLYLSYVLFTLLLVGAMLGVMVWMFDARWRVVS